MDNVPRIDWHLLGTAVDYYVRQGYKYIEVPWIVPSSVNMITCPSEALLMKIAGTTNSLVGSAEQSFLKMQFDGKLPKEKYVACTPCFRVENANDGWHFPTFMKVELYRTDRTDAAAMFDMIEQAEGFFRRMLRDTWRLTRMTTPDGIDLMLNGIEIGSYGVRRFGGVSWLYGTGIALPRLSQAFTHPYSRK